MWHFNFVACSLPLSLPRSVRFSSLPAATMCTPWLREATGAFQTVYYSRRWLSMCGIFSLTRPPWITVGTVGMAFFDSKTHHDVRMLPGRIMDFWSAPFASSFARRFRTVWWKMVSPISVSFELIKANATAQDSTRSQWDGCATYGWNRNAWFPLRRQIETQRWPSPIEPEPEKIRTFPRACMIYQCPRDDVI